MKDNKRPNPEFKFEPKSICPIRGEVFYIREVYKGYWMIINTYYDNITGQWLVVCRVPSLTKLIKKETS